MNLQLRSNTEKHYLQERLTFGGQWDADYGRGGRWRASRPALPAPENHTAQDVRRRGRWVVNFRSETDYTTQPATLYIRPMLYPEIFDAPTNYPNPLQTLDSRRFRTCNSAFSLQRVQPMPVGCHAQRRAQCTGGVHGVVADGHERLRQ